MNIEEIKDHSLHILQLNEWFRAAGRVGDLLDPEDDVEPSSVSVLDEKRNIDDAAHRRGRNLNYDRFGNVLSCNRRLQDESRVLDGRHGI